MTFGRPARRGLAGVLALLAISCLGIAGCVTVKYFRLPDQDEIPDEVFLGHEMEPLFENSIYSSRDDIFRIDICQRQPAPADSTDLGLLPFVRVEDLCLEICDEEYPACPPLEDDDPDWREILDDGFVHGPIYRWGWVHIPDSCQTIEINYTAILVDGADSVEIDRKTVRQTLYRKHDKEPSWVK